MFNFNKYREIKGFLKKTNKTSEIVAISKNHPLKSVLKAVENINEVIRKYKKLPITFPSTTNCNEPCTGGKIIEN